MTEEKKYQDLELLSKEDLLQLEMELDAEIWKLENLVDDKSAMEQGLKLYMNSTYGSYGTRGCALQSLEISATITHMGRSANQEVEKKHLEYWHNEWHLDVETHEKLGIITEDVIPLTEDDDIAVYGDTDSITKDSIIYVNGNSMTIKDFYDSSNKSKSMTLDNGKEVVIIDNKTTYTFDHESNRIKRTRIKNVVRHKNTKRLFKIRTQSGKEIICTQDHNLMVVRNGYIINISPLDLKKTDYFITAHEPLSVKAKEK